VASNRRKTHKVYTINVVEIVTKMAARNTYHQMHQGHYKSIIAYKERFNFAPKSYYEQGNATLKDPDVAMDFFRGLDNVRYTTFKTEFLNGLTFSSIKKPKDINTIFVMANQWLKPKATTSGFASIFSTTLDYLDRLDEKRKGRGKVKGKNSTKSSEANNKGKKKDKKCFVCDELGHFVNKCPKKKRQTEQEADAEDSGAEKRHGNITWDANTFVTHHNVMNIAAMHKFKRTKVLLDNQVDVSVIHPDLLRDLQLAEKTVRINGAGGFQFETSTKGHLQDFFSVYASEKTTVNILSFGEAEEEYDISYIPHTVFIVHLPDRDITFHHCGKLYVADWAEQITDNEKHVYTTVYTKAGEARVNRAYELLHMSGFPLHNEAIHLIEDGNITGLPGHTADDV
jgi:hypothetical protein